MQRFIEEGKPWYLSKTLWAAIVTGLLGAYGGVAPVFGLPPVPEWVYPILGGIGLYGLRKAEQPINKKDSAQKAGTALPDFNEVNPTATTDVAPDFLTGATGVAVGIATEKAKDEVEAKVDRLEGKVDELIDKLAAKVL